MKSSNKPKNHNKWAAKLSDDELCEYVSEMETTGLKMMTAILELVSRFKSKSALYDSAIDELNAYSEYGGA